MSENKTLMQISLCQIILNNNNNKTPVKGRL